MAEPTIVCPQCKIEIMLTESLAAPLLASIRRDYEQRLAQKDLDIAKRERAMEARAQSLDKAKAEIDAQVSRKLEQERARIAAEEAQRQVFDIDEQAMRKRRRAELRRLGVEQIVIDPRAKVDVGDSRALGIDKYLQSGDALVDDGQFVDDHRQRISRHVLGGGQQAASERCDSSRHARHPERALGDQVALDLVRARVDRLGAREQEQPL